MASSSRRRTRGSGRRPSTGLHACVRYACDKHDTTDGRDGRMMDMCDGRDVTDTTARGGTDTTVRGCDF